MVFGKSLRMSEEVQSRTRREIDTLVQEAKNQNNWKSSLRHPEIARHHKIAHPHFNTAPMRTVQHGTFDYDCLGLLSKSLSRQLLGFEGVRPAILTPSLVKWRGDAIGLSEVLISTALLSNMSRWFDPPSRHSVDKVRNRAAS